MSGYGGVPGGFGGYGPPGGMAGPMGPGPVAQLVPGVMKERNFWMVLLLSFVTFGIYGIVYEWKTTAELRDTTQDPSFDPLKQLLIGIITCGIYSIIMLYRKLAKIHQVLAPRDATHQDRAGLVLVLVLVGAFTGGITSVIGFYILNEEFNALARAAGPAQG